MFYHPCFGVLSPYLIFCYHADVLSSYLSLCCMWCLIILFLMFCHHADVLPSLMVFYHHADVLPSLLILCYHAWCFVIIYDTLWYHAMFCHLLWCFVILSDMLLSYLTFVVLSDVLPSCLMFCHLTWCFVILLMFCHHYLICCYLTWHLDVMLMFCHLCLFVCFAFLTKKHKPTEICEPNYGCSDSFHGIRRRRFLWGLIEHNFVNIPFFSPHFCMHFICISLLAFRL